MTKGVFPGIFLLLITSLSIAQQPSNAYLLEWKSQGNKEFQMTALDLLTGFNENGYNNQPFLDDNDLYLSSSWQENSSSHTNIIALNLKAKAIRQVTDTDDAEYSPTVLDDDLYFVRLDAETNYQELWKYDGHALQKVIPETNVAYFTPISSERIAVVLIENKQLVLYEINLKSNQKKKIIDNTGRSIVLGENGVLYFVHKYSPDQWYIKSYDLLTGQIKIVCKTIPGAEDFFLEKDQYIWMAKDQRIYRITIQESIATSWDNIFNLEDYPLNNIGRLCVIGDNKLIFVNQ